MQKPNLSAMRNKIASWNSLMFCKHVFTLIFLGIVGTTRFCSSRDMGNQCQFIRYPDHDRVYRACIYTCGTNDCNTAHTTSFSWINIFLCLFLGFYTFLLNRSSWYHKKETQLLRHSTVRYIWSYCRVFCYKWLHVWQRNSWNIRPALQYRLTQNI